MSQKSNWIYSVGYYNKVKTIKEFVSWGHTDLVMYIHKLRIQLNEATLSLNKKKLSEQKEQFNKKITASDYKQEWSYPTKILFLITWQNKPLTSLEIQTHLKKLDKGFKIIERQQTTLSSILYRACKIGRFHRLKIKGKKELLFALPEWLNHDGLLHDDYLKQVNQF